jgi:WD40 repeat protein
MIRLRCPHAPVVSLAFSPDGDLLAGAGPSEVWCWCRSQGWELTGLQLSGRVSAVAFHPGGRTLAYLGKPPAGPGWEGWVRSHLALDSTGVRFHPLAPDGVVEPDALVLTQQELPYPPPPNWSPGLAFTPDGATVLSNTVAAPGVFWRPRPHVLRWQMARDGGVWRIPEAAPQRVRADDGVLRVGDALVLIGNFGVRVCPLAPGHSTPIVVPLFGNSPAVATAPTGELVAVANGPGVAVWHLRTTDRICLIPVRDDRPSGPALAFSPDGAVLATGSPDGITVWNPWTGQPGETFDFGVGAARSVAYSPDGFLMAVAGDGGVVVADVA